MRVAYSRLHPLPTSPIKAEVPLHFFGSIQSQPPLPTSPLMGEVGRGWSHARGDLK